MNVDGLGIRDVRVANTSLLGKLTWDIMHSAHKPWVQVISNTCLQNSSILCMPKPKNTSYVWNNVLRPRMPF
uniref:Uncharacterized protein n=1 Tax=Cajanus cajan TaxID=3821 RepID=A0A151TA57_CAJCA|nr:hypothetical protein KK1_018503 [Cajanus cajan]